MNSEEKQPNKAEETRLMKRYKQYLKLEKGLSARTLEAYGQDV